MASKCSPMERYVNNAAINPDPHSSAMNSNKSTNPISITNVMKKKTNMYHEKAEGGNNGKEQTVKG